MIVGVILAGGRARRMGGGDKAFLVLDGVPLIERVTDRLRPQVAAMVISANGAEERFARFGLPVVADTVPGFAGPLAGLLAGMEWARTTVGGASHVVTVAVDTPFFPADLVARLSSAVPGGGLAVAASGGRPHPVFALTSLGLAADLAAFIAERRSLKVADWQARQVATVVDFDPTAEGGDPFFNINTPDDLVIAATLAALRQPLT
jgi:molybdopterin-guanine dinucleotide biosynthesis protein A